MRSSMHLVCSAAASALLFQVAPAWAKPWKGAELITQETFRYGAFEARILAARGSGLITPFFLWKNNSEVPGQEWQEQDFEIFGKDGSYQTQLMTPGQDGEQRTPHEEYHDLPQPAWERYYTYRMEWTPEYLAFYVDGELVRFETDAEEYDKLLNPDRAEAAQLRVGVWAGDTSWSGSFDEAAVPAASFVNWVQTYSYTPGSGPNGGDFSPLWRDDFDAPGTTAPNSSRWWAANWTFDYAVNDYVGPNARVEDGALVLAFTDEASIGELPDVPADVADGGDEGDGGGSDGGSSSCTDGGATLAAESLSATTGGATSDGWNLWSNGSLSTQHQFGASSSVVSVRARGELGGGAWPHLIVSVDGRAIGDVIVSSASFESYEFIATGSGARELTVTFDNDFYQDGEDRNLVVDTVSIEPVCE